MKFLKKLLKIVITIALVLVVSFLIVKVFLGEARPNGEEGPRAERLADDMLEAMNYEGYQNLREISWTYGLGDHHYVWNKEKDSVELKWGEDRVLFHTETLKGSAYSNGMELSGQAAKDKIQDAWEYFANDSFWLVAPFKVRDPGTTLELVTTDIGHGLLVTYNSGGVTPGDSYLWILDNKDRPVAWQMWVSMIPIGGLEFQWSGWEEHQGVWFATKHKGPIPVSIDILNLEVK